MAVRTGLTQEQADIVLSWAEELGILSHNHIEEDHWEWRSSHPHRADQSHLGVPMSRRVGILVVNRFELLRRAQKSGATAKRLAPPGLTREEVYRRYRGFDGQVWPELEHPLFETEDGLADINDAIVVDDYVAKLSARDECDVVALARVDTNDAYLLAKGWRPAGFDVGYFESEWSHFSVVLNEIIFGTIQELRRFAHTLNDHFLVPTLEQALQIFKEHERLAAAGADVEEISHGEAIKVFIR